jgi:hypothetical protein
MRELRSNLDEACCVEVAIEREGFADPSSPHDSEARRVDKRIFPLVAPAQPLPGIDLNRVVYVYDTDIGQGRQPVYEPHGHRVT